MFRYFDTLDDSLLQNDQNHNKIIKKLNNITEGLSSADKELLLKLVNEVYYKYQKSIQTKSESDTELLISTIMALLVEQNQELSKFNEIKTRSLA
jgi:hypothetical protein